MLFKFFCFWFKNNLLYPIYTIEIEKRVGDMKKKFTKTIFFIYLCPVLKSFK